MSADGSLDAALFLRRGASRVGAERIALLEAEIARIKAHRDKAAAHRAFRADIEDRRAVARPRLTPVAERRQHFDVARGEHRR